VTPAELTTFFAASAAVAGSLVGLLFVAISLRYEAVLGASAEGANRAVAAAAFTALTNGLVLSLWALVPHLDLGYPASALALGSIWSTLRTHLTGSARRDTSTRLFIGSLLLYLFELVIGAILIAQPGEGGWVYDLAYVVVGAFAAALARSWQLLQPPPQPALTGGDPEGAPAGHERSGPIATAVRALVRSRPGAAPWWRR